MCSILWARVFFIEDDCKTAICLSKKKSFHVARNLQDVQSEIHTAHESNKVDKKQKSTCMQQANLGISKDLKESLSWLPIRHTARSLSSKVFKAEAIN